MTDDSGGGPRVFMMPVSRDQWLDEFKRTVDRPFTFGPEGNRPEALQGLERTRIWGTRTGNRNESMWKKLSPGDIMLFYCNDWFFSAGRIEDTLRSSAAGEYIWDSPDSEFIYTVEEYHRIAIPRLDVWNWFEYDENFVRRGLSNVRRERVQSFRSEVDDIWSHIAEYTVDAEIGEILAGTVQLSAAHEEEGKSPQDGGDVDSLELPAHPLGTQLGKFSPANAVRKFTVPPDYWLTSVQYGAIGFLEEDRNQWETFEEGDVVLFHSRQEPSNKALPSQQSALIGAGIVGERYSKSDDWWWDEVADEADEYAEDADFSLVVSFDRMFLTGNWRHIDRSRDVIDKSEAEVRREIEALTNPSLELGRAHEICQKASGQNFPVQHTFATFRDGDGIDLSRPKRVIEEMISLFDEVPTVNVHEPFDGAISTEILDGLYFPDDLGDEILEQVAAALRAGKHVVLTGPPGTGKTEIARRVCRHLAGEYPHLYSGFQTTTATADWSTFDTVGGYMPHESEDDGDELSFTPGIVLNRLRDTQSGVQANEPIVIDELNRADIDKAFGQLFTLLSGQAVQLPYTEGGREIELRPAEGTTGTPADHQYLVPKSWRIFATMNTYDKTSLYEMSYAFMRRFAFVRVPAPEIPEQDAELEDFVLDYVSGWDGVDLDRRECTELGKVWRETNTAIEDRALGPAIIRDMGAYLTQSPGTSLQRNLTQAVISYVFPQLEGVPKRNQIVRNLRGLASIEERTLGSAAREMLQVTITADG